MNRRLAMDRRGFRGNLATDKPHITKRRGRWVCSCNERFAWANTAAEAYYVWSDATTRAVLARKGDYEGRSHT